MQDRLDGQTDGRTDGLSFQEQPMDSNHEHCKNEINKLRLWISKVQGCVETPPHCDQGQSKTMDSASSERENAQFDIDTFLRDFDTYNL